MSTVRPLLGNQRQAVAPEETVWLSASAGTGKTQVLSSRVLRLLLQPDVTPSQILCLTFTKAGASEMAARINATLASWVRMPPTELALHLQAIGADIGPDTLARARTLFACVLDCPGGGLRIDTIHAFAQWLLAAFPEEAGLAPGTRPMEDRDRALLARQVLADVLVEAEEQGDQRLGEALAALTLRMAPDSVEAWLLRCAEARELWFGPGAWQAPLRPRVNVALGLPADASDADLLDLCGETGFDCAALRRCLEAYRQWSAATGTKVSGLISAWLEGDVTLRADTLEAMARELFTKEGNAKNLKSLEKIDAGYEAAAECVRASVEAVRERRALLALGDWLAPAFELGRAFALAWDEAKAREGLIDFDDQIREAARLLSDRDAAEWIRYKLDRRFDHILVDEAQDTNAAQWEIIDALTGDFFAGQGQHGDKLRTLFVVGDYKQAIFRFQGTSPRNFEAARRRVQQAMLGAAQNAQQSRSNRATGTLLDLGLERSFRTAQTLLDFVDAALGAIGHEAIGLAEPAEPHVGEDRPGYVALWKPVGLADPDAPGDEDGESGEGWLSRPDREMAERIARQVRQWLDDGFALEKGRRRNAGPGDIMVLVRKRRELAGLIVARLHAAGVPVAGVDRLRLGAPLAVRDVVAALRFAAQPLDDLNLAALLVSPLLGWSQDDLLAHGFRPKGEPLWRHLGRSREPLVAEAVARLLELLRFADFEPPQALIHWILTGPWQGRKKLIARLGREANDPLDEVLNAAQAYAASNVPSLVGFLAWFDAGEGELKREAEGAGDLVRVMTVHGAKGLQAPIVILADAAGKPGQGGALGLEEPPLPGAIRRAVPLPPLRGDERAGRVAEAFDAAAREDLQEHWRLLYVAMTRAEEALFVGGALGLRETEPAQDSWYARLHALFAADQRAPDTIWGWRLEHGVPAAAIDAVEPAAQESVVEVPHWLHAPIGPEPRPPRPLAPSSLGEDRGAEPPLRADPSAAQRGTLIHALLERLPAIEDSRRAPSAEAWLAKNAANLPAAERSEIAAAALEVITDTRWAEVFGPGSLAEVPVAATVDGRVVAGTIDRLVIGPDRIRLIDFKTARRPPAGPEQVPPSTLSQMAAYAAALEIIYPSRTIEAAVLYTHTPQLIAIPSDILARHKARLAQAEESFSGSDVA